MTGARSAGEAGLAPAETWQREESLDGESVVVTTVTIRLKQGEWFVRVSPSDMRRFLAEAGYAQVEDVT